ncbi:S9 family peptidase [Paludibaculum fermentans]|uniref:S9 family peptidase n=1 Tax=Paludibaculum fermentans TaxID=1473598 RepID=A0A7S7NWH3_PALFE|nr:S9 family peptidase [Paludibaculum fermentans]QOY91096.1 S9 family peptidase [Paludibaculum fermentans]
MAAVDVASNGAFAVYGVRSMFADAGKEGEVEYGYRTHLWRVDLNDPAAQPIQLTFGNRNDSSPQLSSDGKWLAFLRTDNAAGGDTKSKPKPQVFLLRMDAPGEPQPVTSLEQGAGSVVWRPDGQALLVSSAIPLSKLDGVPPYSLERPGREYEAYTKEQLEAARPDGDLAQIRAWLYKNGQKDNPTVISRMNFLGEQGLAPEMTISQLFVVDLAAQNKVTQITKGFLPHNNPQWSPDGRLIAYGSFAEAKQHPDRLRRGAVRLMDAAGNGDHAILDDEKHNWQLARFTPDGRQLLVTVSDPADLVYSQPKLALTNLEGQELKLLNEQWDATPQGITYNSDGSILFTSGWHGGFPLLRIRDGHLQMLIESPNGVQLFACGGGKIVYALTSAENPNELYLREPGGKARRLTDLHESWLAGKIVVKPVEKWLTRPDGRRVQYWVMNPEGAEQGKQYPWVLDMHGGPSAMWGPGEFSMWHEFQTFCAWGYGVVYANPRGSSGYGAAFLKANFRNWGAGPAGEVLAALDETVKTNQLVDKDRLFLTGGSYAGYLTAWIVGHDNRFKAAAAQRGVYELSTFYGEGNAYVLVQGAFGGFPWQPEARKILDSESPLTYVSKIQTPLLILHASTDYRTGPTQSQMLFRALEQQGKPVEYIRYPGEGHELTRSGNPGRRMDHMLRMVEFFERYSRNERGAPAATR